MFLYSHNWNTDYCTLPSFLLLKTPHLLSVSSQRHRKHYRNNNPQLESATFLHYPIFSLCYLKTSRTPEVHAREQARSLRRVKGWMTGKCNTKSWRVWLHFAPQPHCWAKQPITKSVTASPSRHSKQRALLDRTHYWHECTSLLFLFFTPLPFTQILLLSRSFTWIL